MLEFKDFLGIFYLGSEYDSKIWDVSEEDISDSLRVELMDEKLRSKIYEITNRSLIIESEIYENNLIFEANGLRATASRVIYSSEESRNNKEIEKLIILSLSTGLKINSSLKALFVYEVATASGYKINNIEIAFIDSFRGNKFQDTSFVYTKKLNIRNDKKLPDDIYCYMANNLIISGDVTPDTSITNRGSSFDYHSRATNSFLKLKRDFWNIINDFKEKKHLIPPSNAEYKVRPNDGEKWVTLPNILKNKAMVDISNPNFVFNYIGSWNDITRDIRVYFDFETISFPFSSFDNAIPYQQIPVQYSVIVSNKKNEILDRVDEIFDLRNNDINHLWIYFKNLVDNLYRENATYIAHFNSFENRSLDQMLKLFEGFEGIEKIKEKVNEITNPLNCLDTNNFFKNNFSFYGFIGKSSIKYLNAWLANHRPALLEKYKIKKYGDLDVSNGLEAQEILSKIYLGILPNSEVIRLIKELKEYCHNDVLGMLSLVNFIEENIKNNIEKNLLNNE